MAQAGLACHQPQIKHLTNIPVKPLYDPALQSVQAEAPAATSKARERGKKGKGIVGRRGGREKGGRKLMEERDSERARLGWHEEIDRTRGVVILLQCEKIRISKEIIISKYINKIVGQGQNS